MAIMRGFATVADAVAWADRVIVADPRPDWAILDICVAGRRPAAEMVTLLRRVPGEADAVRVMRGVLAHLLRALDADDARAERIAHILFSLTLAGELPHEHFGSEPYMIDDAFELVRTGEYGTREQAVADLRRYLEQHASGEPRVLEDIRLAQ
jgi:hypothetical protein